MGWRTAAAVAGAASVAAGSGAGTWWAAYKHLHAQATAARGVIGNIGVHKPPEADGVYAPGGGPVERWRKGVPFDLHLMIFGDSTAAGLGSTTPEGVPGVRIARGLAEETGKRIRLSTKAISGASSKGLRSQVDAMFVTGPAPDAAVMMIGANDVIKQHAARNSAQRLGETVARLRAAGAVVVVGTCPDFGVISAIPQPLRTYMRSCGLRLARAQAAVTRAAGGHAVPLADLLAPEFLAAPEQMFSADQFHPSDAGYELAARQILPVLADALGEWLGGPIPEQPHVSEAAERRRLVALATDALNRFLRKHDHEETVSRMLEVADTGEQRSAMARAR